MMIEYRDGYFDDPGAKASFERYAKRIFGLDFGRWKNRGLWDERYRPFSAFVDGECVASICVYPSEMSIGHEKKTGAQLLTVGTLPEHRSHGIQRKLWERAREWMNRESDFAFLFTDESAAGFYERLGLKRLPEFSETIRCPQTTRASTMQFRKLDLDQDNDYVVVERLARKRTMVSDRIGFINPNLLLFMYLYAFRDWCCYLEEIDAVAVVEETGDRLRIHDIMARKMPRLSDIEGFLAQFGKKELDFLFCTDRLGVTGTEKRKVEDSLLFVSDGFGMEGELIFPSSIRA